MTFKQFKENKNLIGFIYIILAAIIIFLLYKFVIIPENNKQQISNQDNNISQNLEQKKEINTPLIREGGWNWVATAYSDDTNSSPTKGKVFTLTINDDFTFYSTTDCNNVFGKYSLDNSGFSFYDIGHTEMYCEGAMEDKYLEDLGKVENFIFREESSAGILYFKLKDNLGEMIFN